MPHVLEILGAGYTIPETMPAGYADAVAVAYRLGMRQWRISRMAPHASNAAPTGALSRRPQRTFFSTAMSSARISIQTRLPAPTANINNISAQQQPTQKTP